MNAPLVDANTRPLSLSVLLDGMQNGTVVLPDFQRDFDWNDGEIISLVATLIKGWPAGSLLLMSGRPEFFSTREFEYAPKASGEPEYVVLDGQQRLTATYLALRGTGPEMFVMRYSDLDIDASLGAEEIEERIERIDISEWRDEWDSRRQLEESVVPFTALESASDFYEWRDEIVRELAPSERDQRANELSLLYRNLLGNLNHYDFPCVILDKRLPTAAVARIFERINRSGRRLNTFDLMVARAYVPGWNLRDQWEAATREYATLDSFLGDDGLPVLQAIALIDEEDVRQPAVLGLSPRRVHDAWDKAVVAMNAAVEAVQSFGVISPEQLPYKAQLLTLAGLAWDRDLAANSAEIERWFWATSLSGAYEVGSSTRVVSDVRELRSWLDGGPALARPHVSFGTLATATRRRYPPLWRTFMAVLSRAGAEELVDDGTRGESGLKAVSVSLFRPGAGDLHLRIFGQVKASRDTARRSKNETLLGILLGGKPTDEVLTQQLLPLDLVEYAGDPQRLIDRRVELALEYLSSLVGDPIIDLQRAAQD